MNLFNIEKKSKWIDVCMYSVDGYVRLVQMRFGLKTNKKSFRKVRLGFINSLETRSKLFEHVLKFNAE